MRELQRKEGRRQIRHQVIGSFDVYDRVREEFVGRLANIHTNGLMLIGSAALKVDRLYQLEVRLPKSIHGHDVLDVGVDCLWTRYGEESDWHWSGCQIIDVSDQGLQDIKALVAL